MVLAKEIEAKLTSGDVDIDLPPSSAQVLQEHSKTVIALATTFFGVTVTFAEKLLGSTPEPWQTRVLGLVWLALLASVVSATVIVVQINSFVSGKGDNNNPRTFTQVWRTAANASTVSYVLLIMAGGGVGAVGWGRLSQHKHVDAGAALKSASNFGKLLPQFSTTEWAIIQVEHNASKREYSVTMADTTSNKQICLRLDAKNAHVKFYEICRPT